MAKSYPQELRDRVLAACDRGLKTRAVARTFSVSESWVRRIKQRRRETGETTPRPRGGVTVVKIDLARLRALVEQQPDATLRELRQRLGVDCGEPAVCMALGRLGLSFKKKRSMPRSRTVPTWPRPAPSGKAPSPAWTPAG
jgi:transposase